MTHEWPLPGDKPIAITAAGYILWTSLALDTVNLDEIRHFWDATIHVTASSMVEALIAV